MMEQTKENEIKSVSDLAEKLGMDGTIQIICKKCGLGHYRTVEEFALFGNLYGRYQFVCTCGCLNTLDIYNLTRVKEDKS